MDLDERCCKCGSRKMDGGYRIVMVIVLFQSIKHGSFGKHTCTLGYHSHLHLD